MTTQIVRADTSDIDTAARTLAAAFEDYAWTRYVIPDTDYRSRLLELQKLYLGYAHQHGVVGVTSKRDGVIALIPPSAPEPDSATVERIVDLHGDRIDRVASSKFSANAWSLETLGVSPEHQGKGRASALLDFGLEAVRAAGGSLVSLETSDHRNVRLYERFGFKVVREATQSGRPPVWAMTAPL